MPKLSSWRAAMGTALYGADGFYRRPAGGPAAHFRTAAQLGAPFAAALLRLAELADLDTVVDLGAGGGELLGHLHAADPGRTFVGVELAPRPPGLPAAVEWVHELPTGLTGLLVANEWLDNVPLDVVESTGDDWRVVVVDPSTGEEQLDGPPGRPDLDWLARWWPIGPPGRRAEIGLPRDEAWAEVIRCLGGGIAVAVDYGHTQKQRPPYGTLTGYRNGRQVRPVPDGSCDLTAHVAWDSCAAAGRDAGATGTALTTQRAALRALGVDGRRPAYEVAAGDPARFTAELQRASVAGELLDPAGLGGFDWLLHSLGPRPLPAILTFPDGQTGLASR